MYLRTCRLALSLLGAWFVNRQLHSRIQSFWKSNPSPNSQSDAVREAIRSLTSRSTPNEALEILQKIDGEGLSPDMAFHVDKFMGLAHLNANRFAEALIHIDAALKRLSAVVDFTSSGTNIETEELLLLNAKGRALLGSGKFDQAASIFEQALRVNCSNNLAKAVAQTNLGAALTKLGQLDKAMTCFKEALATNIRERGDESLEVAATLHGLAIVYSITDQQDQEIETAEKVLKIYLRQFGEVHEETANAYNTLASAYHNPEKGLPLLQKALKIQQKLLGEEHPQVAAVLNNIGLQYLLKEDYEQAERYAELSLNIRRKVYGENHPEIAFAYGNLAEIQFQRKNLTRAAELYKKCLEIQLKTLGNSHPSVGNTSSYLNRIFYELKDFEKAADCAKLALEVASRNYGENNQLSLDMCLGVGRSFAARGRWSEALPYYEKALGIGINVKGEDTLQVADIINLIGVSHLKMGNNKKALQMFERALALSKKVVGENHRFTTGTQNLVDQAKKSQ